MLRNILRTGILMNHSNVMDCAANCVQQRRASPDGIVSVGHARNLPNVHAVIEHPALIVKKHRGNERLAVRALLLLEHGVKAADRIGLQPAHRTTAVKDKDNLGYIFSHNDSSYSVTG